MELDVKLGLEALREDGQGQWEWTLQERKDDNDRFSGGRESEWVGANGGCDVAWETVKGGIISNALF